MSDRKKVYVETTVVSDATALPAREYLWWNGYAVKQGMYVLAYTLRKCCRKEVGNDRGRKTL